MIAIISCSKKKLKRNRIKARDLYSASALFRYSYQYIKKFYPDIPIYILSAKYGLVSEDTVIDYYDQTLKDYSKEELNNFRKKLDFVGDYIFIGGKIYKKAIGKEPILDIGGGLPIGKKMKYLREELMK